MEARIRELEEQLRNLSLGRVKDLSLAANIKEWSGSKPGKSVREFLSQIDQFGAISQWTDQDRISIVKAKCVGEAQLYIKGVEELNEPGLTYARLKDCLTERFSEQFPLQYYYSQLQEARQEEGESPSQFLDRIRAVTAKTIRKSGNPVEQKILADEAKFRLLSTFIHGMKGEAGKQLRFSMPATVEEALRIAEVIYRAVEMENKEKKKRLFSFRTEKLKCFNCGKIGHMKRDCRFLLGKTASQQNYANSAPRQQPPSYKPLESDERKGADVRATLTCWRCHSPGHIAKHCGKRPRALRTENSRNLN